MVGYRRVRALAIALAVAVVACGGSGSSSVKSGQDRSLSETSSSTIHVSRTDPTRVDVSTGRFRVTAGIEGMEVLDEIPQLSPVGDPGVVVMIGRPGKGPILNVSSSVRTQAAAAAQLKAVRSTAGAQAAAVGAQPAAAISVQVGDFTWRSLTWVEGGRVVMSVNALADTMTAAQLEEVAEGLRAA